MNGSASARRPVRIQRHRDERLGVDVGVAEDPHGHLVRERSGRYVQLVTVAVHREQSFRPPPGRAAPASGSSSTSAARRVGRVAILLVREQVERRGAHHPSRIEHPVLLGLAGTYLLRYREAPGGLVVGTLLSAGTSLKVRIATRSIDSPSAGGSVVPSSRWTSATTGAATGS